MAVAVKHKGYIRLRINTTNLNGEELLATQFLCSCCKVLLPYRTLEEKVFTSGAAFTETTAITGAQQRQGQ